MYQIHREYVLYIIYNCKKIQLKSIRVLFGYVAVRSPHDLKWLTITAKNIQVVLVDFFEKMDENNS